MSLKFSCQFNSSYDTHVYFLFLEEAVIYRSTIQTTVKSQQMKTTVKVQQGVALPSPPKILIVLIGVNQSTGLIDTRSQLSSRQLNPQKEEGTVTIEENRCVRVAYRSHSFAPFLSTRGSVTRTRFCRERVSITAETNAFRVVFAELHSHLLMPYCQACIILILFSFDEKSYSCKMRPTVLSSACSFNCKRSLWSTG